MTAGGMVVSPCAMDERSEKRLFLYSLHVVHRVTEHARQAVLLNVLNLFWNRTASDNDDNLVFMLMHSL